MAQSSRRFFRRVMRSRTVALLTLITVVPLVLSGALGGATIVSHAHHSHGAHWHAAPSREAAIRLADRHVSAHESGRLSEGCPGHRHEPPCSHDEPAEPSAPASEPSVVTLPDHEPMATAVANIASLFSNAPTPLAVDWTLLLAPVVLLEEGSPGGQPRWSGYLCGPTVVARIVRTSSALLI